MRTYYHVVTNPEEYSNTATIREAIEYYSKGLEPRIPMSASHLEDRVTPRVCLGPTVEKCLTAIGFSLGPCPYKRILVLEFDLEDSEIYTPTVEQLYDVVSTGEVWSLAPIKPSRVRVEWIGQFSMKKIVRYGSDGQGWLEVLECNFLTKDEIDIMEAQQAEERCRAMSQVRMVPLKGMNLD